MIVGWSIWREKLKPLYYVINANAMEMHRIHIIRKLFKAAYVTSHTSLQYQESGDRAEALDGVGILTGSIYRIPH